MQSQRKNIFKQLGMILWAFGTLILLFLVVFLARHMIVQGQNPLKLVTEDKEEFNQQEFSKERVTTAGNHPVTLYFASREGTVLREERVEIETALTTAENCKHALQKIIAGPVSQSLLPIMPADTRIRAVYLRDDGELIVDISSELLFSEMVPRSLEMESLMFFGITNALTLPELQGNDEKNVSCVRFLFDGLAAQENFPLNLDLAVPLYSDSTLIAQKVNG